MSPAKHQRGTTGESHSAFRGLGGLAMRVCREGSQTYDAEPVPAEVRPW